ncbi:MAG: hypothetical protein KDA41_07695 [Planctomycetales bacterium]|nr:hypothetical protein [Planctomycetales bacterium]
MVDALHKRGRTMEERFFAGHNANLLEQLRQRELDKITKADISAATGIHDDDLLDRLIGLNINLETLAALSLIPLVEVAWADGTMHDKEREAILQATAEAGIPTGGPGHQLLSQWLNEKPHADLLPAWKDFVGALAQSLDAKGYAEVKDNLLSRARQVAEAAGGILGIGKISAAEQQMLDALAAAFV